ncbi:CsbD family protein [Methylicorpusculum sp.]|uniref:CsbD family protein n=1 Tax=Methylicorpusculum sp. TaxID=2713644 RepID=UPI002727706F|nr:CsbD family protein [Methylicorpusculum sp.]MDO8846698.1 CsbD family protein [Methylicorpusculum sp.]
MNKDQAKGRVEEAKGKVKETIGKMLDDKGMEVEGNVQKNVGKGRAGWGDLKDDLKKNK